MLILSARETSLKKRSKSCFILLCSINTNGFDSVVIDTVTLTLWLYMAFWDAPLPSGPPVCSAPPGSAVWWPTAGHYCQTATSATTRGLWIRRRPSSASFWSGQAQIPAGWEWRLGWGWLGIQVRCHCLPYLGARKYRNHVTVMSLYSLCSYQVKHWRLVKNTCLTLWLYI